MFNTCVSTSPGLTGDALWVQLGLEALRLSGAKDVLALGGGGAEQPPLGV